MHVEPFLMYQHFSIFFFFPYPILLPKVNPFHFIIVSCGGGYFDLRIIHNLILQTSWHNHKTQFYVLHHYKSHKSLFIIYIYTYRHTLFVLSPIFRLIIPTVGVAKRWKHQFIGCFISFVCRTSFFTFTLNTSKLKHFCKGKQRYWFLVQLNLSRQKNSRRWRRRGRGGMVGISHNYKCRSHILEEK